MKIDRIQVGVLECNCYLLEKNHQCLLIDPGDDYQKIQEFIKGKDILGILITHSHYDHIASLDYLVREYSLKSYDITNLEEDNQIGPFHFKVIETKGHTMDLITIYFEEEKVMFTGDFLFKNTIGRCDLPESNPNEMKKSLQIIKKYPCDITIYPGHGSKTTLREEFLNNPYLKGEFF